MRGKWHHVRTVLKDQKNEWMDCYTKRWNCYIHLLITYIFSTAYGYSYGVTDSWQLGQECHLTRGSPGRDIAAGRGQQAGATAGNASSCWRDRGVVSWLGYFVDQEILLIGVGEFLLTCVRFVGCCLADVALARTVVPWRGPLVSVWSL